MSTSQIDRAAVFDADFYVEARRNRLNNLLMHIDAAALPGRRILELGCGTGELGQAFVERGCEVVSIDASPEHIDVLRSRYPDREAYAMDLERLDSEEVGGTLGRLGRFDAILCFGLLYHLATPTRFLAACAAIADELYLETVVLDRLTETCEIVAEEGPDQAFSGYGCRPSPRWLEAALPRVGYDVRDISTAAANWGGDWPSAFDWEPRNDGRFRRGSTYLRKMYICTRP